MNITKRALPNFLTLSRTLLIIPIIMTVNYDLKLALFIFCIAALTDAFDGYLARKWLVTSQLGATLDPLADKII